MRYDLKMEMLKKIEELEYDDSSTIIPEEILYDSATSIIRRLCEKIPFKPNSTTVSLIIKEIKNSSIKKGIISIIINPADNQYDSIFAFVEENIGLSISFTCEDGIYSYLMGKLLFYDNTAIDYLKSISNIDIIKNIDNILPADYIPQFERIGIAPDKEYNISEVSSLYDAIHCDSNQCDAIQNDMHNESSFILK